MNIQKILEYQKIDMEAADMENQLESSEFKVQMNAMRKIITDSKNLSYNLEKEAEEITKDYDSMKKTYDNDIKVFEQISKKLDTASSEKELSTYDKTILDILNNFNVLDNKLRKQAQRINQVIAQFNKAKNTFKNAKENLEKNKAQYTEIENQIKPKLDALRVELSSLEKAIDPKFLAKYKTLKDDKIKLPYFVKLDDENRCGKCRIELAIAQVEKLKKDGFIECDSCHRIIYVD